MKHLLYIPLLLLLVFGCDKKPAEAQTQSETSDQTPPPQDEVFVPMPNAMSDSLKQRITAFTIDKNEIRCDAFGVVLRLEHTDPWIPVTTDQVPWLGRDYKATPQVGLFLTYMELGQEKSLNNPYINAAYFSRHMPYCSTPDSNYIWLEKLKYPMAIVKENKKVKTLDNNIAHCREYHIPTHDSPNGTIEEKFILYAIVEYNLDYLVSLSLTTQYDHEMERLRDSFYYLVENYREEKE